MIPEERTLTTVRYERLRAVTTGVIETAGTTFMLLIAVRWFHAGPTAKAMIASGGSFGLLMAPLFVYIVEKLKWRTSLAAALISTGGAVAFLSIYLFPVLPVFLIGSIIGTASSSALIPLVTQMYQENYPGPRRGRLFSQSMMIRIAAAAAFSDLAGRALSLDMRNYSLLLLIFCLCALFSGYCLASCPSSPLVFEGRTDLWRGLRFAKTDRLFRQTLICWMLMGFANLMMLPMRVEYLANPRYGMALSAAEVAFFVGVVPNIARLLMSPVWGALFDRANFFVLRVSVNIGFAVGIIAFFMGGEWYSLMIGAITLGIANAGGDIAWSLWVTKFAPADRVADYMSTHTFFTGLRGIVAPLVAFHLANRISIESMGWICAGLIILASVLLLPEIRSGTVIEPGAGVAKSS